jgi:predicted nucleic acid-binding protein
VIVVDASVLANVVGDDGADGRRARRQLRAADALAAPDLVDVETVAVLRKRWLAGSITDRRFAAAIGDLEDIDLDRYPALRFMRRAFELRANVTAYDAAYVALAEVLGCELWTADHRLAKAPGSACGIRVLRVRRNAVMSLAPRPCC